MINNEGRKYNAQSKNPLVNFCFRGREARMAHQDLLVLKECRERRVDLVILDCRENR
jgi:hypothetical protein